MDERDRLIDLLRERSVERGLFRLASGRTSSYYIDARRTTMTAVGLELIGVLGCRALEQAGWRPDAVGGLTLGADPVAHAIALASRSHPPAIDAFTVRKEPKTHGSGRAIEGAFQAGQHVVVVEDVLTSGQSALRAVDAVRAAGGQVLGVLVVVDREQGGRESIERSELSVLALVRARDLGIAPEST